MRETNSKLISRKKYASTALIKFTFSTLWNDDIVEETFAGTIFEIKGGEFEVGTDGVGQILVCCENQVSCQKS